MTETKMTETKMTETKNDRGICMGSLYFLLLASV